MSVCNALIYKARVDGGVTVVAAEASAGLLSSNPSGIDGTVIRTNGRCDSDV